MAATAWPTRSMSVASLHLDSRNPRLGRETTARAPRDVIQYLFEHDKAIEVAESIAVRGYFPNEPLLAVREGERVIVVEGNRRLAALKALREPGLLEGPFVRRLERLARRIQAPSLISHVPVTMAPNRRATDRLVAGRHIGTPVLSWQAENRASFILDKLAEGYDNNELADELGFDHADIQAARQTRAIADMARSLELPDEVRAKLDNPRTKLFTTLERVFQSKVGRDFFRVEPDAEHGLRGRTSKSDFVRGFQKLVTDVALGHASSRTLNKGRDMENYFGKWPRELRPRMGGGSFVPSDVISGRSVASPAVRTAPGPARGTRRVSPTVVPKTLRVRYGTDRLVDIRRELTKLRRADFPNAGAVLLRVFLELAIVDYLNRTGRMSDLTSRLKARGDRLPFDIPSLKHLSPEIVRIARDRLPRSEATRVEKALKYDEAAPFSIADLHAFVHGQEFPGERDILQFWSRTEPLFRMMLEQPPDEDAK